MGVVMSAAFHEILLANATKIGMRQRTVKTNIMSGVIEYISSN
jgi:hypothetical protein